MILVRRAVLVVLQLLHKIVVVIVDVKQTVAVDQLYIMKN
jgi:hypothetical protein